MINPTIRPSGRKNTEIGRVKIKTNYIKNAHGSCLISFRNTSIICAATIDKCLKNEK